MSDRCRYRQYLQVIVAIQFGNGKNLSAEEKKAATYDNFLKVEVGESYDDTVKELGEPNKLVTEGDTNTYFWTLENGGSISAIVEDGKIVSMSQGLLTGESTSITIDQYNKLQDGMTIEEVQAIAGSGTLTTEEQMDGYVRSFYSYKLGKGQAS